MPAPSKGMFASSGTIRSSDHHFADANEHTEIQEVGASKCALAVQVDPFQQPLDSTKAKMGIENGKVDQARKETIAVKAHLMSVEQKLQGLRNRLTKDLSTLRLLILRNEDGQAIPQDDVLSLLKHLQDMSEQMLEALEPFEPPNKKQWLEQLLQDINQTLLDDDEEVPEDPVLVARDEPLPRNMMIVVDPATGAKTVTEKLVDVSDHEKDDSPSSVKSSTEIASSSAAVHPTSGIEGPSSSQQKTGAPTTKSLPFPQNLAKAIGYHWRSTKKNTEMLYTPIERGVCKSVLIDHVPGHLTATELSHIISSEVPQITFAVGFTTGTLTCPSIMILAHCKWHHDAEKLAEKGLSIDGRKVRVLHLLTPTHPSMPAHIVNAKGFTPLYRVHGVLNAATAGKTSLNRVVPVKMWEYSKEEVEGEKAELLASAATREFQNTRVKMQKHTWAPSGKGIVEQGDNASADTGKENAPPDEHIAVSEIQNMETDPIGMALNLAEASIRKLRLDNPGHFEIDPTLLPFFGHPDSAEVAATAQNVTDVAVSEQVGASLPGHQANSNVPHRPAFPVELQFRQPASSLFNPTTPRPKQQEDPPVRKLNENWRRL
ncbi:hypothetical protein EJ06DRAFT_21764 [Trichodelitschia bisporula]|uniref:Uncharacterized protein n=1 Tax=Trichodelitschia bisporula TaxID=703511 RepID=A0A6G1IBG2_9PEZI|nr:hypothetical protein EJ06DRAFT_21764 [Trichodelitschia bisporula]